MADTTTVDKRAWTRLLDRFTEDHEGEYVTIELFDPEEGLHGHEAERLPFNYANYDYKDDVAIVAVGGATPQYPVVLRHLVYHPTDVSIATGAAAGAAFQVIDPDGTTTIATFFAEPGPDRGGEAGGPT